MRSEALAAAVIVAVSAGWCADGYLNARHRSALLEIPSGTGGIRELPSQRLEGDGSLRWEGMVPLDPRTLRWQLEGAVDGNWTPYGDQGGSWNSAVLEATADLDLGETWYIEAGKRKLKLGTGYFRRPSDLFVADPARSRTEFGERADRLREGLLGAGLVAIQPLWQFQAWASPRLNWSDSGLVSRHLSSPQPYWQGFARWSSTIHGFDGGLTLRGASKQGEDWSGDAAIDVVGLVAANTEAHLDMRVASSFDRILVLDGARRPTRERVKYPVQLLLGIAHSFSPNWNLIGEYYHNGEGLSGPAYRSTIRHLRDAKLRGDGGSSVRDAYGSLSVGTHYAMSRLAYSDGSRFLGEVLTVQNLQDGGAYRGMRLGYSPEEVVRVTLDVGAMSGDHDTETGSLIERWRIETALEYFL